MSILTKGTALIVLCVALAACGDARIEAMQVSAGGSQQKNHTIVVTDVFGSPSQWQSDVDPQSFKEALQRSLTAQGYGQAAADNGMVLKAYIAPTDLPSSGYTMYAAAGVRYELIRQSDGLVLIDQVVTSEGIADSHDSPIGMERARMAVEKAMRANIESFLALLAARGY